MKQTMYNFEYYENTGWMSQGLIDALNAWELLYTNQQPIYAGLLTQLKTLLADKATAQGTLADYQATALAKEGVVKVMIESGQKNTLS